MGWNTEPNFNIKDYVKQFNYKEMEVVSYKRNKEIYVAIRNKETNDVTAIVCLITKHKNETLSKVMHECTGPYYYNCPKEILNLLTPTNNNNSLDWRETCLNNIQKLEKNKNLKKGDHFLLYEKEYFVSSMNKNILVYSLVDKQYYSLKKSQLKDITLL
jgi:hypothetical protein